MDLLTEFFLFVDAKLEHAKLQHLVDGHGEGHLVVAVSAAAERLLKAQEDLDRAWREWG